MERRLAAVLAADVAGYGRLTARDEEGTHTRLRAAIVAVFVPVAEALGGCLVRSRGDDVLITFPSAVSAVRAALRAQAAIEAQAEPEAPALAFRVGIHSGDVLEDGGEIYGDAVNIAFRLQALAPAGGICVSAAVAEHLGSAADIAVEPVGRRRLKHVSRPIMVFAATDPGAGSATLPRRTRLWRVAPAVLGAALALMLMVSFGIANRTGGAPEQGAPAIAILPFETTVSPASWSGFAPGLVGDVTTDLARFDGISIIAVPPRLEAADPDAIRDELGARYLLTGRVQWLPETARVYAQLIHTPSNAVVWVERYDHAVDDLATGQQTIAAKIARAIGPIGVGEGPLRPIERRRVDHLPTDSPKSFDQYFAGIVALDPLTEVSNTRARLAFERSIDIDPFFAPAQAYLAIAHLNDHRHGWSVDAAATLAQAERHAERAVALDGANALAQRALGLVRLFQARPEEALAALEAAVTLNPHNSDAAMDYGWALSHQGRAGEGLLMMRDAFERADQPPGWYREAMAGAAILAGEAAAAVAILEAQATRSDRALLLLAMAQTRLGQSTEARAAMAAFRAAEPGFTVELAAARSPLPPGPDRALYLDTLRRAGLPED